MSHSSAGAKTEAETDRREGSGKHLSHKELGVTVVGVEEEQEEGV